MLRTGNFKFYTLAALAVFMMLCVGSSWAQAFPDTFSVNYYSNAHTVGAPDGKVRVDNPGVDDGNNLCADVYVFDNSEELLECCGCLVTPDDLRTMSINADLTGNTSNGSAPTSGVIKIVSAATNPRAGFGACDPTGGASLRGFPNNIKPTPDVRAWATHIQSPFFGRPAFLATDEEFEDSTLSTFELTSLQRACFGVRQLGSGRGICKCGTGS